MDEPHFMPVDVLTRVLAFCKFTESWLQTSFSNFFTTTECPETATTEIPTNLDIQMIWVEEREGILNMQEIMTSKEGYYFLSRHHS